VLTIAQAKEENWQYHSPQLDVGIEAVVCSLDGAYLLMANDGWREAVVGTFSLYDTGGNRQHTTCLGASPEYGKEGFYRRYEQELNPLKSQYPNACYLGIADGAKSNWTFLCQHTHRQILDYFHATEYLSKAAVAAYPEKTGKPKRKQWLKDRCHQLKHEQGAAQHILDESVGFRKKYSLNQTTREELDPTITYFENQISRMDYASHIRNKLPIGPGVVEAACKTLVKQRFCQPGMRWKQAGLKAVMSLRALVLTKGRWDQFWAKIQKYGVPGMA
jgi:hypothetical protein